MFEGLSLKQLKQNFEGENPTFCQILSYKGGTTKLLTYYTTNYKGQTKKLIPFYMTDILFTEL